MIRFTAFFMAAWLTAMTGPLAQADEARTLVLVTGSGESELNLSSAEIRRLFLGLPVGGQKPPVTALINRTDALLHQVFLQKVIFMSSHLYERQLLTNVVRQGGQRPPVYTDRQALLNALRAQPNSVTYMWRDQIPADADLVVVTEIWKGRVD